MVKIKSLDEYIEEYIKEKNYYAKMLTACYYTFIVVIVLNSPAEIKVKLFALICMGILFWVLYLVIRISDNITSDIKKEYIGAYNDYVKREKRRELKLKYYKNKYGDSK